MPDTSIEHVDVVVVGLGPGGEHVAGRLAERGLSVVGVEKRLVGGECPYYGCVPSKMMIRAANSVAEAGRVATLAGSAHVQPRFRTVADRISNEATDGWDDTVAVDRLVGKGARFVRGSGVLVGERRVRVADTIFQARIGVVLATGTAPAIPPIPGLAQTPLWTNREIMRVTHAPESLVVLGGGAIGVELAQVFARFGSAVTVVEAADRLLSLEEPESGSLVAEVFSKEGITVRTGASATAVSHGAAGFTLELSDGTTVGGEKLLVATGRDAGLRNMGLETVGVTPGKGGLEVDDRLRLAAGLWALGDITGKGAFTHVSMYQAEIVVKDILGEPGPPADYRALPKVIFTDPEIGSVGMTAHQAQQDGYTIAVGIAQAPSSARGWIHGVGNDGFIKLVADADRGVILGATSAGPFGGEVLGLLTLAVHAEVPIKQLRAMMYAYPTFHRGITDALRAVEEGD